MSVQQGRIVSRKTESDNANAIAEPLVRVLWRRCMAIAGLAADSIDIALRVASVGPVPLPACNHPARRPPGRTARERCGALVGTPILACTPPLADGGMLGVAGAPTE